MENKSISNDTDTGPKTVNLQHLLLATQITTVKVKDNYVFIGEGQFLHLHNLTSGKRLITIKVFCAAVIHGIQVQPYDTRDENKWILIVWGQKSLAVVALCPSTCKWKIIQKEKCFEDWIIDAAWEHSLSHIVVATAHNVLLRCSLPEWREVTYGKYDLKTEHDDTFQKRCDHSDIDGDSNLSEKHLDRVVSTEICILYCGCLVLASGVWESTVFLAGTVFSEVLVWGPWAEKDELGRCIPQHRLSGHQGVLFSINFCPLQNIVTTTSDDRTLRVWSIKGRQQDPSCSPECEKKYWTESCITESFVCFGHTARVWRSLILPSCIVTVGEDSMVCLWDQKGSLMTSWKAHEGSSIWSVAASKDASLLVTGGGDGSVKSWCLNFRNSIKAEPLSELPWVGETRNLIRAKEVNATCLDYNSQDKNDTLKNESGSIAKNSCDTVGEENNLLSYFETENVQNSAKDGVMKMRNDFSKNDFPRCVSLLGTNRMLLALNSGKLYLCDLRSSSSWDLIYEDSKLSSYVIMETCPNNRLVALGTLTGYIFIFRYDEDTATLVILMKACDGKIFGLHWLSSDIILTCKTGGGLTTWTLKEQDETLLKDAEYVLPPCKQRWVSAACLLPQEIQPKLVCGDRGGSLHLYSGQVPEAQHSLRSIHGKNGVTSLSCYRGLIYSTGRDGCVRTIVVKEEHLEVINISRITNINWVAGIKFLHGRTLALCFFDTQMKVWSVEEDRAVVEVECGGGHRSWALQTCESEDALTYFFLKDGFPYVLRTTLKDKLLPVIKMPVNTKETMCLQVLVQLGEETIFATGGEDTTLRLHSVCGVEKYKSLSILRTHLSNIRALCIIEWDDTIGGRDVVWLISAGGRAQVKVWKITWKRHSTKNTKCTKCQSQGNINLEKDVSDAVKGTNCREKQEFITENSDPCTACDCDYQSVDTMCQEVTSHMLRSGSHKTWKSQELTFDPETRYMDAAAFWVTETEAVVALASSDGVLRLFLFDTQRIRMELLSSQECGHCLLKVTRLRVGSRNILITTATNGTVAFWDLWQVIKRIHESDSSEEFTPSLLTIPQVASVEAHQSGVNALSFWQKKDDNNATSTITMATGGDDNKISIWNVTINISRPENIWMDISHVCDSFGHASQISGLHWVEENYLVTASIDQRVILWKLKLSNGDSNQNEDKMGRECRVEGSSDVCRRTAASPVTLQAVSSSFTGVADVKGITSYSKNRIGHSFHCSI